MKFTIKATLESVSLAVAKLRNEELVGGFAIECKTETGRYMRELAPFFGKPGAIRITFEVESPQGETSPHGTLPHPANVFTHPMAPMAARDERPCLCPATSEYDPPCPTHGVLGIGVTGQATAPAPPLVNGRPSCCREWDKRDDVLWIRGQWIIGTIGVHAPVRFCPFCGAKLPEVPR